LLQHAQMKQCILAFYSINQSLECYVTSKIRHWNHKLDHSALCDFVFPFSCSGHDIQYTLALANVWLFHITNHVLQSHFARSVRGCRLIYWVWGALRRSWIATACMWTQIVAACSCWSFHCSCKLHHAERRHMRSSSRAATWWRMDMTPLVWSYSLVKKV
jgi:hypothetical protein